MDPFTQSINLIQRSRNILILPPNRFETNSLEPVLNLYYTLKKLDKNVKLNLKGSEDDKIMGGKEFILSVNIGDKKPKRMYYEKNGQNLDIHLGLIRGEITKNDVSIKEKPYIQPKIDLIITLGRNEIDLDGDNFEFFSQKPIINIDNQSKNKIFGQVNLVFPDLSLDKIVTKLIERLDKNGNNFNRSLFRRIIEKLNLVSPQNVYLATLKKEDFEETNSKPKDLAQAIKELKLNPYLKLPNLILLWEYHHSPLSVKGVCFDENNQIAKKILNHFPGQIKGEGAIFQTKAENIESAKEKILKIL